MKKICALLLLALTVSQKSLACSYSFPSSLDALHELDFLFEGELHAVYVNEKQVSSQVLREHLYSTTGRQKITYKVKPINVYLGEPRELFELVAWHEATNSCSSAVAVLAEGSLWGGVLRNGTIITNGYLATIADSAKSLLVTAKKYHDLLTHLTADSDLSPSGRQFVLKEKALLDQLTRNEPAGYKVNFYASYANLKELPKQALQARLEFLLEAGMVSVANETQYLILTNPQ